MGIVCVDKGGQPVRHLFGKRSFEPEETFDTLITCDQCLGLEDMPEKSSEDSELIGEISSLAKDVKSLKDTTKNLTVNVNLLNKKIFPSGVPWGGLDEEPEKVPELEAATVQSKAPAAAPAGSPASAPASAPAPGKKVNFAVWAAPPEEDQEEYATASDEEGEPASEEAEPISDEGARPTHHQRPHKAVHEHHHLRMRRRAVHHKKKTHLRHSHGHRSRKEQSDTEYEAAAEAAANEAMAAEAIEAADPPDASEESTETSAGGELAS